LRTSLSNQVESEADFYPLLAEVVTRRYYANWDKSIWDVYRLNADFLEVGEELLQFITAERDMISRVLANPVFFSRLLDLFVNKTLEFLYANNQFIRVNRKEEWELVRIYNVYLHGMKSILAASPTFEALEYRLRKLVAAHFWNLRLNITRYFDSDLSQEDRANVILRQAVCSDYSPEFQLNILGIRLDQLVEPVLDLGCGKAGQLVHYLIEKGIQARGIDRLVDAAEALTRSDWLELNIEPGVWGTVISHMAFSNHFNFNHLYQHGSPERYARQYMAILASLKPGGTFYYTPGLPFIEKLLPEQVYTVEKTGIQHGVGTRTALADLPVGETFYVSRVMRKEKSGR